MKISSLSMAPVKCRANYQQLKKAENSNFKNDSIKTYSPVFYYPLTPSFKGSYTIDDKLADEVRYSTLAKVADIKAPEIKGSYSIDAEIADYEKNPVSEAQLEATLEGIFKMDEIGLFHGDLEKAHIFYKRGEKTPEFDCFRYGFLFNEDKGRCDWEFAPCVYPTNLMQFENNWISYYTANMSKDERRAFITNYLILSSDFHDRKAQYLVDNNLGTQDQVEFERLQAKYYATPTSELIDLFDNRISVMYLDRLAFTECDEGRGAGNREIDENRIIKGNLLYFEVLKNNLKYLNKISKLKENETDPDLIKLYGYLEQCALHEDENQITANKGRTIWSTNPDNKKENLHHRKDCKEEKESYEIMYNGLIEASKSGKRDLEMDMLHMTQMQYGVIVNRSKSE